MVTTLFSDMSKLLACLFVVFKEISQINPDRRFIQARFFIMTNQKNDWSPGMLAFVGSWRVHCHPLPKVSVRGGGGGEGGVVEGSRQFELELFAPDFGPLVFFYVTIHLYLHVSSFAKVFDFTFFNFPCLFVFILIVFFNRHGWFACFLVDEHRTARMFYSTVMHHSALARIPVSCPHSAALFLQFSFHATALSRVGSTGLAVPIEGTGTLDASTNSWKPGGRVLESQSLRSGDGNVSTPRSGSSHQQKKTN